MIPSTPAPQPRLSPWMLVLLFEVIAALGALQFIYDSYTSWLWFAGMLLLGALCGVVYLPSKGKSLYWTTITALGGMGLMLLVFMVSITGVFSPLLGAWVLLVAAAFILLGRRQGWAYGGLALAAVLVVLTLQQTGVLHFEFRHPPPSIWLTEILILLTAVLLQRAMLLLFNRSEAAVKEAAQQKEKTHRAFETSEARNRAILEALPDIVFRLSPDGMILDVSIGEQANWPTRPEALLRKRVQEFLTSRSTDQTMQAISWSLSGYGMQTFEMEFRHPSQGLRIFESRVVSLNEDSVIMFLRDITVRMQAEKDLRESYERFEIVSKVTSDVMWDWDLQTDRLWWNENYSVVFGHGAAPDHIDQWDDHIHPDERAEVGRSLRFVIAGGSPVWSHNYRFLKSDGSYADVYDRGVVLRDAQGNPARMIGAMMDISEQKRVEQERTERLYRMEILDTVSRELADVGLNNDAVLQAIVKNSVRLIGDLCMVVLLSDQPGHTRLAAVHHPDEKIRDQIEFLLGNRLLSVNTGLSGEVFRSGAAVVLNGISGRESRYRFKKELSPFFDSHEVYASISVPMLVQNRPIGVITLLRLEQDRPYSTEDQTLLQNMADRAGLTLSNARLYAENADQAEQLREANAVLEQRILERTRELAEANEMLTRLATQDGLTGLSNRRHFDEMIALEIRRAKRTSQYLTLILCDIDHFKLYNDNYGHPEGDQCLRQVATTLKAMFRRAGDVVARYGGEEFAMVLPNTGPEQAELLVQRMQNELYNLNLPHAFSKVSDRVTLSIGVVSSQVQDHDAVTPQMLIKASDEALYESKHAGRNRATFRVLQEELS
ncbi:GGDEF domain-containing protein [Deinococcus roseus]|nr:GGDEF domain-containing protein [Deinococcus roseus]